MNVREDASRAALAADPAVDEQTRADVLRYLLLTFIALTAIVSLIGLVVGSYDRALLAAIGALVYALLLAAMRRLGVTRTGYVTMGWYLLLAVGAMAAGDGIHDVTIVLFPTGIMMGALLLDRAHVLPLTLLFTTCVSAIGVYRIRVPSVSTSPTGLADVVIASLLLLASGALTQVVMRSLRRTLQRRRDAEAEARRSQSELQVRNESLQVLNELADQLHGTLDVDVIAAHAVDVLARHEGAPRVAFYLVDDDHTHLRLAAERGFNEEERAAGMTLPLDGSMSGIAVRDRRVAVAHGLATDARLNKPIGPLLAARGLDTAIAVPLLYGSEALGTVNLIFAGRREFTPLDLETHQAMARTISLAITNARHVAGLEYQAFHDALTALPNRWSLHKRFEELQRSANGVGLLLVDLNRFREINEALGHRIADDLLRQMATRLSLGREGGRSEVFRLGGDEFAVLLTGVTTRDEARLRAQRVQEAIRERCDVAGLALEVDASIGVALHPDDGTSSHDLLRSAEVAMYRAKQTAAGVVVYRRELDRHTPERLALLADLAEAVRTDALELHFQPKISLTSGAITGFEALVRWSHPKLGPLPPADFVPLAETTAVINPLTYWVVRRALEQLRRWDATFPELTMAINLSARNLLDADCSQRLEEIIRAAGVNPERVVFELTETAVMIDPEAALTMLRRITAIGARLDIDDFGTGYSSLVYLKQFPLHGIKIDRSFVADVATAEQSLTIVRSTVQLARSLGLSVVAEGIEDRQTADALREIGCDLAQGYYFARPAPAEDVTRLLRHERQASGRLSVAPPPAADPA